jgi:hypothetical protein
MPLLKTFTAAYPFCVIEKFEAAVQVRRLFVQIPLDPK